MCVCTRENAIAWCASIGYRLSRKKKFTSAIRDFSDVKISITGQLDNIHVSVECLYHAG